MFWLKKRTLDWWIFTLLPLIVFGLIALLVSFDKSIFILLILTQQLFFYCVILSSTEIGIRFKLNLEYEEKNRFKSSGPAILILIFSSILLGVSYLRGDIFNFYGVFFFITSLFFMLGSIWLSNQNEYSGVDYKFEQEKIKRTKDFSNKVENPKEDYKGVKIENE